MSRRLIALLGAVVTLLALVFAVTGSGAPGPPARIAYVGTDAIYLANIDGTGRELVVRGVAEHTTLAWSPSGKRLAFSGGNSRAEVLFSVNLEGSGIKRLTRMPGVLKRTGPRIRVGRRTESGSRSMAPGRRSATG